MSIIHRMMKFSGRARFEISWRIKLTETRRNIEPFPRKKPKLLLHMDKEDPWRDSLDDPDPLKEQTKEKMRRGLNNNPLVRKQKDPLAFHSLKIL